jgi:hypothetical protein
LGAAGIFCCSPYFWLIGISYGEKIHANQPLMLLTNYAIAILALPASCVTLTSGFGLLYRKSWGRKLAVWKAVFGILLILCVEPIVILSLFTNSILSAAQKKNSLAINLPVVLVEMAYSILLIFFLTRKPVKQAVGENP